jgi:hypothetical protein
MSNDRHVPSDIEALAAVKRRNRLREQFGLHAVDPQHELDRLHQVRESRALEQWMQSHLRYRVRQKMLLRVRRRTNNPSWEPTGFLSGGGWAFHILLVKQIQKLRVRLGGRLPS